MRFKTAIFDMDGVVIDSERLWDAADTEFFKLHGAIFSPAEMSPVLAGMDFMEIIRLIKARFGFEGTVEKLAQQRMNLLVGQFEQNLKFIPGYVRFHQKLHRVGIQTCIATASPPEALAAAIRKLNLNERFGDRIFKIADVGYKSKPDPAIFLYAAQQMKSKPSECFVIEDSPKGIQAAKNAGMRCVGITTTFAADKLKSADMIVDKFSEIDLTKL